MKTRILITTLTAGMISASSATVVFFDDFEADTNNPSTDATTGGYSDTTDVTGAWIAHITFDVVPEPSTTALLGLGGLALILRRRK